MPPLKRFIAAIAIFILSCFLFFTPSDDLPDLGDWFGDWSMDKVIHSGLFFVLSLCWFYPFKDREKRKRKKAYLVLALLIIGYGVASEFIQLYLIRGRSFSMLDIAADTAGVIIAFVFADAILKKVFWRPATI